MKFFRRYELRLQGCEDRNPEAVFCLVAIALIFGSVAIYASAVDGGWTLVGQSLKETFWPW